MAWRPRDEPYQHSGDHSPPRRHVSESPLSTEAGEIHHTIPFVSPIHLIGGIFIAGMAVFRPVRVIFPTLNFSHKTYLFGSVKSGGFSTNPPNSSPQ